MRIRTGPSKISSGAPPTASAAVRSTDAPQSSVPDLAAIYHHGSENVVRKRSAV
jgi:hypothetical protein